MKKIKLTQDRYTIVDDNLYNILSKHNWYLNKNKNKLYARREETKDGKRKVVYLHRYIFELKNIDINGYHIDHINGNGLDNRFINIRKCTQSQNLHNISMPKHNTSGKKGVYFNKNKQRWVAEIFINNKKKYLGSSESFNEACEIRDHEGKKLCGEFYHP